ncbi:MAG: hypothetical protein ACP6IS_04295 [Candidatus Asgardarchaeia archaeon]
MQTENFSQVMYYLDSFFRWFAPYSREILRFISENIDPYLSKIVAILAEVANRLPEDTIYYIITMISLMILGVVFNRIFEKES